MVVEVVAGFRAVAVAAVLLGLGGTTERREADEMMDFLSSSLALMLARLAEAVVDEDVGRRAVEIALLARGRVGGLLRPPVVLVAAVGALAVLVVAVLSLRAAVEAVVPALALEAAGALAEPATRGDAVVEGVVLVRGSDMVVVGD